MLKRLLLLCFWISSSLSGASPCPRFLSREWRKERLNVANAHQSMASWMDRYPWENEPEFQQLQAFHARVTKLLRGPMAAQAVEAVDKAPELLELAQEWIRSHQSLMVLLERRAAIIRASKLRLARSRKSQRVLERYSEFVRAYRQVEEITRWKEDISRTALLEGLAASTSFLNFPYMFYSATVDEDRFIQKEKPFYDQIFHDWDQISSSLQQFRSSGWNMHFGARAFARAQRMASAIHSREQARKELLSKDEGEPLRVYIQHEKGYFAQMVFESESVMDLVLRVLKDLRPAPIRAQYKRLQELEWEEAVAMAQDFLRSMREHNQSESSRVQEEDPFVGLRSIPLPPEGVGILPYQRSYLQEVASLSTDFAHELYPQELLGEMESLGSRMTLMELGPLAFWTWCYQLDKLSEVALRRAETAERLGLYDGHGMDPGAPDSVLIGRMQRVGESLRQQLARRGCFLNYPEPGRSVPANENKPVNPHSAP
jgi:hypothetical protein